MISIKEGIVVRAAVKALGRVWPFAHAPMGVSPTGMGVLAALLAATVAGCAASRDGERPAAHWVGAFPGQYRPFAACMSDSTAQRVTVRAVYDDAAQTAELIVTPPLFYAIADHEITVAQADPDKVRVVFRRRTAMDFGQTEQHVKFLAWGCGKTT